MPIAMSPPAPSPPPRILFLGDPVKYEPKIYERLKSQFDIVRPSNEQLQRPAFLQHLEGGSWGDFQAIMRPSWHTGGEMGKWDEELINLLPLGVKVYASAGAGYDWVDTDCLAEHGASMEIHYEHVLELDHKYCLIKLIVFALIRIPIRHNILQWRRRIHRSRRRHGSPPHHLRLPRNVLVRPRRPITRPQTIPQSPSRNTSRLTESSASYSRYCRTWPDRLRRRKESVCCMWDEDHLSRHQAEKPRTGERSASSIL